MRWNGWGSLAAALAGLLIGATTFLGFLWSRHVVADILARGEGRGPLPAPALSWWLGEVVVFILPAALSAGLAAVLSAAWARKRHEAALRQLEQTLAFACKAPTTNVFESLRPLGLEGVVRHLDVLVTGYRQALVEVVQVQERVENLEAQRRRADAEARKLGSTIRHPSSILVQSARHRLVARLASNFHITAATQPLLRFLGRTQVDLVGHSLLEVVHQGDVGSLRQALEEALYEGEAHDVTIRVALSATDTTEGHFGPPSQVIAHTGAGERYLKMDVMTSYDESGAPVHLRCHFLDVTERMLTERELLRSTREVSEANACLRKTNEDLQRLKESYRDLYHYAPVLYFSLDARGNLVAFNETMLRTLGYPREALLGQPYATLLTPPAQDAFLANPEVVQRPGELQTQWVKQDGTVIDVWVGTTTIRDATGAFVRSRSAARDVSEYHRLARELADKAEEVGRANAQLRRINQELEEFTYVVSHDLKEPLRTVEAFSTFLKQDCGPALGEEGRDHIEHLIQASRRLKALIDDLLTLSRAGQVIHTPRPFRWENILDTVRRDLHGLIQQNHAQLRVEGPLPPAVGDGGRVTQLLTNLVSNALKYNRGADPQVVIGHRPGDEVGFVTVFVRDNGVGIDPQFHDEIFRIFRRLHRQDEVEGTGAGLAICKRIVEAQGGRIWVESRPEQGATFCFTLPRQGATATDS